MYRAVILTDPGFQDQDVVYVNYRLRGEEDYEVEIATTGGQPVRGKYGVPVPLDLTAGPLISFDDLVVSRYDAVICTGGHEAPDRVRQNPQALAFVKGMYAAGKVVAGICHGTRVMISAGIMRGRRACADGATKDDLINAGAQVINAPVVVDNTIITCSYHPCVEAFMRAVLETAEQQPTGSLVRV